jgi:monoterpene epsilon-lactone hydrolase
MSLRLALVTAYMRWVEKPFLARAPGPATVRARFERSARLFRDPPFSLYLPDRFGGVPGLWVQNRRTGPGVILFLHGGAYVMGSPRTHRAMVARLCRQSGAAAALPDYRLAPEHPFPAALEDAGAAWAGLRARGHAAGEILLAGDSAGGGLALALLALLLAQGERPAGLVAFSPWTDMTLSGESLAANAAADPLLPAARVTEARDTYLQGADPADPRASPLFADFPGAPPVFLQAARTEILIDDTRRMAHGCDAGGAVTLDLWEDAPHVWPILRPGARGRHRAGAGGGVHPGSASRASAIR